MNAHQWPDLVNLFNPHPWIFWVTVQGPIFLARWRFDPLASVAFVAAFYIAIVGSNQRSLALRLDGSLAAWGNPGDPIVADTPTTPPPSATLTK